MRKKDLAAKTTRYEQTVALAGIARPKAADRVPGNDALLTPAEVARILHVSRGMIYALIKNGELPSVAIRRVRRIRASDLDRFIEKGWKGGSEEKADSGESREKDPGAEKVQGRVAKWKTENDPIAHSGPISEAIQRTRDPSQAPSHE